MSPTSPTPSVPTRPSRFAKRQEHMAAVRLILAVVMLLAMLLVGYLFVRPSFSAGEDPHRAERIVVWIVLTIGTLLALVEFGYARLWRLRVSEERLRMLDQRGWQPSEQPLTPETSWFDRVVAAAIDLAEAEAQHHKLETLPEASDIIGPVRAQAEKSVLLLRWMASAAVLIGLLSTLYGLSVAIHEVADVIGKSGDANFKFDALAGPLRSLQLCFFGSGLGVACSIALGYLRSLYEAELDAHFGDIEHDLRAQLPLIFADFTPPTGRLVEATSQFVQLSANMQTLMEGVKTQTEAILNAAVAAIKLQLEPLPAQLISNLQAGMRQGTSDCLGMIATDRQTYDRQLRDAEQNLFRYMKELADKLEGLRTGAATDLGKLQAALLNNVDTSLSAFRSQGLEQGKLITAQAESFANKLGDVDKKRETAASEFTAQLTLANKSLTLAATTTRTEIEGLVGSARSQIEAELKLLQELRKEVVASKDEVTRSLQDSRNEVSGAMGRIVQEASTKLSESIKKADAAIQAAESSARKSVESAALLDPLIRNLQSFAAAGTKYMETSSGFVDRIGALNGTLNEIKKALDIQIDKLTNLVEVDGANQSDLVEVLEGLKNCLPRTNG